MIPESGMFLWWTLVCCLGEDCGSIWSAGLEKPLSSQWAFLWQLGSYWVECRQLEPGLWDFRRKFGECLSYSQGYLCYIFMKTMWKDRRHAPWWIALAVLSEDLVWSPVPSWWLTIPLPVDPLLSSDLHKNCCMHSWWIDIKAPYILEKKKKNSPKRSLLCFIGTNDAAWLELKKHSWLVREQQHWDKIISSSGSAHRSCGVRWDGEKLNLKLAADLGNVYESPT